MADGSFPGLVSKDRNVNAVANPIWVELTDGSTAVNFTGTSLDVNVTGGGGGTQYQVDSVAGATDTGMLGLFVRDDALTTLTPVDGDYVQGRTNSTGAIWVAHDGDITIADGGNSITVDGTVAATQSGTWTVDLGATDNAVLDQIELNTDFGTVVGGGAEATALRVTIANDSTGVLSIDDNGGSITVDGTVTVTATQLDIDDLNLTDDAVRISGNTSANSETNPIYVKEVAEVASGNEIHSYDTTAAVASDATDNHDYTVAGTTFFLKSVIASCSGSMKFEVQTGPVAGLTTVAVGFLNGRQGDTKQLTFDPPVEVPVTSTGTVRVIRTNRQGTATDVYSTIIGYDV